MEKADITIIGGGPGGYVAAIKAAQLGADVVLVEKENVGGTCLNWGCIPTKALVRSAEVYREFQKAKEYGIKAGDISLSLRRVMARKKKVVTRLVKGVEYLLRKNDVRLIEGSGDIKDKDTVVVSGEEDLEIETDNIIIATGSRVSKLPIEGADLPGVIFSRDALSLKELPEKMVIIGAGIIGMEFATIFSGFGVKVEVVEYMDKILPGIDSELSEEMSKQVRRKKIKTHTGSRVERITEEDGEYVVHYSHQGEEKSIKGEKVLMAVGREPDTGGIDVQSLGIEINEDGKGIKVNDRMETSVPGIYAIGDVTNRVLLAHVASHQGIVAVENILGRETKMDYTAVPSAIFTDPEIATVGIDEDQAREKGLAIKTGKFPFSANGKALAHGDVSGFIKLISEKDSGRVIGGSIIGVHATDLIAELTLAVKNRLTAREIAETIHAHPTTAEVIHEAALATGGNAIHYI